MQLKALLAALPLVGAVENIPCTHKHNDKTHYDLSELAARKEMTVTGGDLKWTDAVEEEYSYQFAVCRKLSSSNGEVPDICETQGENDAPVYQFSTGGQGDCHVAGELTSDTKVELMDELRPAAGVMVNYTDGSKCHRARNNGECGKDGQPECPNRQTAIFFVCSADEIAPWGALEVNAMGQPSHCEYRVAINSMYACPQECGISYDSDSKTRKLCGGHGICDYDKTNKGAKCFCDDGWAGKDCNTEFDSSVMPGSGMSGTAVGLLVVLLLISIALVGLVVFMAKQVRAYRNDATNYMQIRGQEMSEEIGTI